MLLAPRRRSRGRPRRLSRALALGLCIGAGGALFAASPTGVAFEEQLGLTWLFTVRGPIAPPPDVVVVSLDKHSAKILGLPAQPRRWPRTVEARLVEALARRGASAIGIDLILSEYGRRADDAAFATAIAEAGNVVLFEHLERRRQPMTIGEARASGGLWIEQTHPPIPELAAAAAAVAPFPLPKVGASVKQFWSFKRGAGDAPTLPAVVLQLHELDAYQRWINALEGDGVLEVGQLPFIAGGIGAGGMAEAMRASRSAYRAQGGLDKMTAARARPAWSGGARAKATRGDRWDRRAVDAIAGLYAGADNHYLNFYGPPGTIPIIPFARLLAPDAGPESAGPLIDIAGKSVFVGVAELDDPGQPDGFYSVFSRPDGVDLSGVEIAATAFANMLGGQTIDPASPVIGGGILLAFGLALGIGALLMPATIVIPSAIAVAALYALAAQTLFNRDDLWLPLATPVLLQMPLALLVGLLGQYVLVHRQRQSISRAIGYYLPAKIAEGLRDGGTIAPNALDETVYATCLASDLEDFTAIAETMTPDAVAKYLKALDLALPQADPNAIAAAAIGGDDEGLGLEIARSAQALPPAPDALDREGGRVSIDADIDPALVGGNVVDAIGCDLA